MTLSDLKSMVDAYVVTGHGDDTVLITLSQPGIGAQAATGIIGIYPGFDWEHGQMRIRTEQDVCLRGRAKDDVMPIHINAFSGPRRFYTCPLCGEHIKKDSRYCQRCGQHLVLDESKEPVDAWKANSCN